MDKLALNGPFGVDHLEVDPGRRDTGVTSLQEVNAAEMLNIEGGLDWGGLLENVAHGSLPVIHSLFV